MSDDSFKPTQKMAANARKGLELRAKFHRGGTEVGVHRAEQLARQDELGEEDVKSMHSYFARHAVDKEGKSHEWVFTHGVASCDGLRAWSVEVRRGLARADEG